jgi:3-deoxy-D-manno-oct-2-ulosonic acid (Kdo) hydroxylase
MLHEAKAGEDGQAWSDALENGRIVRFARCPIELPAQQDQDFLRAELAQWLRRKNVSFYPGAGRLVGLNAPRDIVERTRNILRDHARRVREFLQSSMPAFTRGWRVGTSSYRPLEEQGRGLSAHASNELVHVDAGAYGATHGDRILRFFVNLNPQRERVWSSKGSFAELWQKHGAQAGVPAADLEPALPERIYAGAVRAAERAFPMLRVVDTSPYDRRMRRFHNWMKDTPSFQAGPGERFAFAPFSAWMVLTDGVSHACISGQHALVDTFLVPLENCRIPAQAPYRVLSLAR